MKTWEEIIADLPADPIDRAEVAAGMIEEARRAEERLAAIRRQAIYDATRTMSYAQAARLLGVSVAAINKAVTLAAAGGSR